MPSDPTRLAEELDREKQEVARLRGLLLERDAELGAARGKLFELETRLRYVLGAFHRLNGVLHRLQELLSQGLKLLAGRSRAQG